MCVFPSICSYFSTSNLHINFPRNINLNVIMSISILSVSILLFVGNRVREIRNRNIYVRYIFCPHYLIAKRITFIHTTKIQS